MKTIFLVIIALFISYQTHAQIMFTADLTGDQETPPVSTNAKATGFFVLNADSSSLTVRVTYAGLQGTFVSSHFHIGTFGISGPVVMPILFKGNTATLTWKNVPDTVISKLLSEDVYINIHSTLYPNGEIRGQLRRVNGIGFTSSMFGSQETPPVLTEAQGTAYAILMNKGSEIKFASTIAGMSSAVTGSHFHNGVFGVSGPVVNPITFTDSTSSGTWTGFPDSIITELLKNRLYINVHTSNNPDGEIRGQFFRQTDIMFKISMDAAQETSPVMSSGKATGWAVISKNLANLSYSITYANLSAPLSASHFHHGLAGVSGPVLESITFNGNQVVFTKDGISDSLIRFFIKGEMYANIHTSNYPNGEIRGQVEPINGIGFTSVLNGMQTTPPSNSPAVGTGWLIFGTPDSETDSSFYQFTIANLSAPLTAAHFHNAPRNVSGNVVEPITFTDSTVASSWLINDPFILLELFKGNIYANVHTSNFPLGEIRGQMFYAGVASGSVTDVKDIAADIPGDYSLSQNYPNPFNPSTKIKYSVPSDGNVKLKVYNLIGEEVAVLVNQQVKAGTYEINWNAGNHPSGIYFYRLEAGKYSSVMKMILLK